MLVGDEIESSSERIEPEFESSTADEETPILFGFFFAEEDEEFARLLLFEAGELLLEDEERLLLLLLLFLVFTEGELFTVFVEGLLLLFEEELLVAVLLKVAGELFETLLAVLRSVRGMISDEETRCSIGRRSCLGDVALFGFEVFEIEKLFVCVVVLLLFVSAGFETVR